MSRWRFFFRKDNQTPASAVELVSHLERGEDVTPTRGPDTLPTYRENERVLAGFEDGRADEGAGAGESSLLGLRIARERDWTVPEEEGQ